MDHRFEISDPNYLLIHVHIVNMVKTSKATTASKKPQRSKLRLKVRLVTPIYYVIMFQGSFIIRENMTFGGGGETNYHI